MVIETIARMLYKMAIFKKGSLSILSFSLSIGVYEVWKKLMIGVNVRDLFLPILIFCVGFILYFIFLCADLHTGLQVAKYQSYIRNKGKRVDYVKSYKLYRTLWKLLGVTLMGSLLMITTLILILISYDFLQKTVLLISLTVWILAAGFELHSIGENHKKRYGYKPRIFRFFDIILNSFEKKVINKVDESFIDLNKNDKDGQDND